jgi:hypothetical protein
LPAGRFSAGILNASSLNRNVAFGWEEAVATGADSEREVDTTAKRSLLHLRAPGSTLLGHAGSCNDRFPNGTRLSRGKTTRVSGYFGSEKFKGAWNPRQLGESA